jgi:hypothetical protein
VPIYATSWQYMSQKSFWNSILRKIEKCCIFATLKVEIFHIIFIYSLWSFLNSILFSKLSKESQNFKVKTLKLCFVLRFILFHLTTINDKFATWYSNKSITIKISAIGLKIICLPIMGSKCLWNILKVLFLCFFFRKNGYTTATFKAKG